MLSDLSLFFSSFRNVLADPAEIIKFTIIKELKAKGGEFDNIDIDQESIKLKPG